MKRMTVPDIGDFKNVPVIEVLVAVGDTIVKDQPIAVLESDKAVMEIPSSDAGVVTAVEIKVGDRISAGAPLLSVQSAAAAEPMSRQEEPAVHAPSSPAPEPEQNIVHVEAPLQAPEPLSVSKGNVIAFAQPATKEPDSRIYAGPAVRKLARELGVDLVDVRGSGPRGRIVPQDVHAHVKSLVSTRTVDVHQAGTMPFAIAPWPKVDYAKFGPVESQPLSRIRRISGPNLHRNWVSIPHVTNHDDADVTDLEIFRAELNRELEKKGVKVSPLAFILKACVAVLKAFPEFNASLDDQNLILKRYYHIGFAADTPNGLVVPVIRNADQKGIVEIASEMAELSLKAREGKLSGAEMQGGTFSISSLGGIGGSYFTPIINAPEVAILGVGRTQVRVIWSEERPQPRTYLPLSLSWDHRVVDGATAGRFNAHLVKLLSDVRRLLL
ncbi:MAG: dihydrolipoyllysine-residue acetyltransferase [Steroidobacteraceae bacterium]